jgi:hypothetical protein
MRYPACDPAQTQASSSETDMQTISDSEISSRGLAALEKMLDNGPVHVIKDARVGVWDILLGNHAFGIQRRRRGSIDADISVERDSWDDR